MAIPTRIFLRDDDVGLLTPQLERFVRLFAEGGVPVSYQVIPERFTPECAAFMKGTLAGHAGLLEFGQHGLRHQMVVKGELKNHEFGPERSFDQQLSDIQEGQALMRERLGGDVRLDVFTPPRHRYDRNTLKAIRASGFEVLSASSYTTPAHRLAYTGARLFGLTNLGPPGVPRHGRVRPDCGLFELSVAVGVDDGHTPLGTVQDLIAKVQQARRHTQDVGVLFHHQVFEGAEREQFLRDMFAALTALSDVSFHTIGDLYALHRA